MENDLARGADAGAGTFCYVTLAPFPSMLEHPVQVIIIGSLNGLLRFRPAVQVLSKVLSLPFHLHIEYEMKHGRCCTLAVCRAEPEEVEEEREVANILPSETYETGNPCWSNRQSATTQHQGGKAHGIVSVPNRMRSPWSIAKLHVNVSNTHGGRGGSDPQPPFHVVTVLEESDSFSLTPH